MPDRAGLPEREGTRNDDEVFWRRDGTPLPVEYSSSPIRAHGTIQGTVVTFFDNTQRKRFVRRLSIQHAVSSVLAEAATFSEAAPRLLCDIGEALDWQRGVVWSVDWQARVLRRLATWHAPSVAGTNFESKTQRFTLRPEKACLDKVWASGKPAWSTDIQEEYESPLASLSAAEGLHGALAFPIRLGHAVLGVLEFFSAAMQPPDKDLLQTVATLGYQIGQFIERERAEEGLRQSEALKGAILQTAIDGIITTDHDGTIVEWNAAAEKLFGFRRDEALGRELVELIVPLRLRDQHRRGLGSFLQTGAESMLERRVELLGLHADGREFPMELAVTRIPSKGGPRLHGPRARHHRTQRSRSSPHRAAASVGAGCGRWHRGNPERSPARNAPPLRRGPGPPSGRRVCADLDLK